MGKIIAIVNQKGGVGKTTTAVNLTAALRDQGRRVLLCDFDPQANASSGMGISRRASHTSYDVIIGGASVELAAMENREYILKAALSPLKADYDFIFIDCPPSLELLTLNGLCACEQILIPVQCEYYALEGLSDLMSTMRAVKKRLNPNLSIFGVLLTMYDARTNFSNQVAQEVRKHFPGKVFQAMIPRNVRLAEAPSYGEPVTAYDRHSRGARAYRDVAEEIIRQG